MEWKIGYLGKIIFKIEQPDYQTYRNYIRDKFLNEVKARLNDEQKWNL